MYIGIPKVSGAYARKWTAAFSCVRFPYSCDAHRHNLQGQNIGILINHELPIYIRYLRTALNECSMLLALLAIWTNADYSWPKTLVLCRRQEMVWCRQPIGAHGAFVCGARDALVCVVCGWRWSSCASGERSHSDTAFSYCGPQSWSACACVCAYASTSPAGCWREASRTLVG